MFEKFIKTIIKRVFIPAAILIAVLLLLMLKLHPLFALVCFLGSAACFFYLRKRMDGDISADIKRFEESLSAQNRDFTDAMYKNIFIPMCVTDRDCGLYYENEAFSRLFGDGEAFRREVGKNFVRQFENGENLRANITVKNKNFRVCSADVGALGEGKRLLIFENFSAARVMQSLYGQHRVSVAIVSVDNYDELINSSPVEERSVISAKIDKQILQDAASREAAVIKTEKSRYFEVFEDRFLQDLRNSGFPILTAMHDIETNVDFPTSVSIGVGSGAVSISELQFYASDALELAFGRGGDQAVVKSRGKDAEFYGGALTTVAKRNKGKSRIVAHALGHLLESADSVFIMGHKNPDIDSLGACMGVSAIARGYKVPARIVLDDDLDAVDLMHDAAKATGLYEFVSPAEALNLATEKSLLVVADVRIPFMTAAPELLKKIEKTVVIDHHRRSTDTIENPTLAFTETYASSASELVTELAQYSGGRVLLEKSDANALLAGITLDSKGFTSNSGVRTFEAASWLRRCGADSAEVQSYFKMDLDFYKKKVNIFASAELLEDGTAVAYTNEKDPAMQTIVAQAADELLKMRGVSAAIVAGKRGDSTVVSARSDGSVNVQVLMEKLGGGGHVNMAAAQVKEGPEEAIQTAVNHMREARRSGGSEKEKGETQDEDYFA